MKVTEREVIELDFEFTEKEKEGIEIVEELFDKITNLDEWQMEELAQQLEDRNICECAETIRIKDLYTTYAILTTLLGMID